MKMNHFNVSKGPMAKSTAELSADGLINAIVAEVERLQSDQFINTTATSDSLLFNHTTCDSVYLNEMLVKLGPEFPAVELDARPVIKAPSDCDNRLPETNLDRGDDGKIFLSRNECGTEERSTELGVEVETRLNRLQQQQEMILKNNSDLNSQVIQQREMILDLQQNNLDLNSQVKKQQELILALQEQLNTITEIYRLNFQALMDERRKSQNTKIHQELTTAELTDRVQIGIAEIDDAITTIERSSLTDCCQMDQLQDVKRPAVPIRNEKDDGLRMLFNLETIEESPKEAGVRHSHKKSKNYSCAECKKQFKQKSDLTTHFRIHTGEKPYKCNDCGAVFSRLGNLRTHHRTHSGEKPYNCEECGAAFNHSGSFKIHQRTHSGEKPFDCEDCGAAFSQSSNLRTHRRIHSGEKPYNCEDCGAAFSQLGNLRTHQRTHSGGKSHQCNMHGAPLIPL